MSKNSLSRRARFRHQWIARALVLSAMSMATPTYAALFSWTGGGLDGNWTNGANWSTNPTIPANDGTAEVEIVNFGAGSTINPIAVLGTAGETLTLRRTGIDGASGGPTAQWRQRTRDGVPIVVNTNIQLNAAAGPGSYVADWREVNNSNGGANFNGAITEAAGQDWTIEFRQNSARGNFRLFNTGNDISTWKLVNTTVNVAATGALGTGSVQMAGGTLSIDANHFTTSMGNTIDFAANGAIVVNANTKFTGVFNQNTRTFTKNGGGLLYLDPSSNTGTAETQVNGGSLAVQSMSDLSTGALRLGQNGGTFVLSANPGGDTPTLADFFAARTFNQAGGAGTWRIDGPIGTAPNGPAALGGGFAARGGDIVIPKDGNTTNTTFARGFTLGSRTAVGADRYANGAIEIQQDIDLPAGTLGNASVAWQAIGGNIIDGDTGWTLSGPVHEVSGQISGGSAGTVLAILGSGTNKDANLIGGMLRISNPLNNFTAESITIALNRNHTTTGGTKVFNGNEWENQGGAVAIFTSDAAFGNAAEIRVFGGGDSGRTGGLLLFEDATGTGTTFARNILINDSGNRSAGFGSFDGLATYAGTATLTGTSQELTLHVQSNTLSLNGATIVNNRTAANTEEYNKSGPGTLSLDKVLYSGNANTWHIYGGAIRENGTAANNSLAAYNVKLRGGVIEIGADLAPGDAGADFVRGLSTNAATAGTIDLSGTIGPGGGGFSAFGADRIVAIGGSATPAALTWASTSGFVSAGRPLIFGSQTADAALFFKNNLNLNNGIREIRVVDNVNDTDDRAVLQGVLSSTTAASGGITKTGAGVLELAAVNTYTGLTTVNEGTLRVAGTGSLPGSVVVNNSGTLHNLGALGANVAVNDGGFFKGTGSVAGTVTINDGGAFSPGNSPGGMTVENEVWNGGGIYKFEINDFAGSPGANPGWDLLTVNNTLDILATQANPFIIELITLDLSGNAGLASGFLATQGYDLLIATASNLNGFDPLAFTIDGTAFQNSIAGGTFGLDFRNGEDLFLTFRPQQTPGGGGSGVPEPSSAMLLLAAATGMATRRQKA